MAAKVKEQSIAMFGESGSGKTVLLSSLYGATQQPSFVKDSLFRVLADDTGQGHRLVQNYLRMRNQSQVPAGTKLAAIPYSFTLRPRDARDGKAHPFSALRLIWHDYPGEWFTNDPSSDVEARRRVDTFTKLMRSDVALVLVDGQQLVDHAGEEEKYLKSMFYSLNSGLERLRDDILVGGKPLTEFPRIWVLALSKADLHPDLDARGLHDLIVEKSADDLTMLRDTLKTFVQVPEALSLGEDFMLLSSAKFAPGKIELTERVGLDLILPVATMLPLERLAQWVEKFDVPVKILRGLIDNVEDYAPLLVGGAAIAAKLLAKVPKVGSLLSSATVPVLTAALNLSKDRLVEIHDRALADQDYLAAILTQFRLDLERGVQDNLLVTSSQ